VNKTPKIGIIKFQRHQQYSNKRKTEHKLQSSLAISWSFHHWPWVAAMAFSHSGPDGHKRMEIMGGVEPGQCYFFFGSIEEYTFLGGGGGGGGFFFSEEEAHGRKKWKTRTNKG